MSIDQHPNCSIMYHRRFHFKSVILSGVLNAADCYGLDELRAACTGFADTGGGITVDTACALLASAERYIHYKCTKSLVQKVRKGMGEGSEGKPLLAISCVLYVPRGFITDNNILFDFVVVVDIISENSRKLT